MSIKIRNTVLAAIALILGSLAVAAPAQAGCNGTKCYGSVVTNPNSTAYGYAYNRVSGRSANNAAQANCPGNCRIYVIFRNSCGAIAVGQNGVYGWAANKSRSAAKRDAVRNCAKYGSGCKLRVWSCTRYSRS